jgi:NADH-quinone oxidoreductase subunit N
MYFKEGTGETVAISSVFRGLLILVAGLIILFGIFPNMILNYLYF